MKEKKIKVLMVGPDRQGRGGIASVVNEYYEAGIEDQIQLRYIATMKDGSKLKKVLIAARGLIEFCVCMPTYEIVHVHMASRASFYRKSIFVRLAYKSGKKIVIHVHGAQFQQFVEQECNARQQAQVRHIFEMADLVLCLSKEWQEYFEGICSPDKIRVLHNAVPMPQETEQSKNLEVPPISGVPKILHYRNKPNDNILFLGRVGERKGMTDLLQIMPKLIADNPKVKLYVGGDGEIRRYEKLCNELNIGESVQFLGWLSKEEKAKYLKLCSIFVLPSYNEGMPVSLLEAMSYGCAVVASNVGGIPQVMNHQVNGIMIEPGDQVALKQSLQELLQNPELKTQMSEEAVRTISEEFSIEKNIAKLVGMYRELA